MQTSNKSIMDQSITGIKVLSESKPCITEWSLPEHTSRVETWRDRTNARRKAIGMSQERLAEAMDMTPAGVQKWLAGQRQPALEDIDRIAAILGVPGATLTHGVTPDDLCTDLADPARAVIRRLIVGARSQRFDKLFFERLNTVVDLADSPRVAPPDPEQAARPSATGEVVFEQAAREAEAAHAGVRVAARKRK